MPDWSVPLITTVLTPFLVIIVTLLSWVVLEFRNDYKKMKDEYPKLEKRVDELETERDTAKQTAKNAVSDLDTERLEHTQTKRMLERERTEHLEEIKRRDAQHLKDIDQIKAENNRAIDLRVRSEIDTAVSGLRKQIESLETENRTLRSQVNRVEKISTDQLNKGVVPNE